MLTDVELLCLVVTQHLLGIASDRKWIRYAHTHLIGMFPNLPQQSGWGKRVRQATGLLSAVITELARDTPFWGEITRLIDSTPVPCGKSRETVKRSDLAGHAGYGYCASHSRYFGGFRLYLVCTPDGRTSPRQQRSYRTAAVAEQVGLARLWFNHECSWDAAARAAGMHRHSLCDRVRTLARSLEIDIEAVEGRATLWALLVAADA